MDFFTHQMGVPAPLALVAIAAEFFGGLGLFVGLLGRVAATGIICNMLVAVVLVHSHVGLFMNWYGNQQGEGFEYHLLAIALGLAVAVKGSGAFSCDRLLTRPSHESIGQVGENVDRNTVSCERRIGSMTTGAAILVLTAFLASAVEAVEALTVVLAVGVTRGWRSSLIGAGTATLALAAVIVALGPALSLMPIDTCA